MASLPAAVLRAIMRHLGASECAALARCCKALRASCWPAPQVERLTAASFPPASHLPHDLGEAARRVRGDHPTDEAHLAALRVLLTQATRFPRVRLASASFQGCGPNARGLLEACGLREEVPGSGYLSATSPLAKARLSEGREMLEVLVAQLETAGMESLLGKMLLHGAGTAAAMRTPLLGAAESCGRRLTSEDAMCGGEGWAAVLDGHGGRNAALLAACALPEELAKNGFSALGVRSVLANLHRAIVRAKLRAGTTAVLAVAQRDELLVGWVGDSRAVLFRIGGAFLRLSEDHRPSNESEARRVAAAGGRVSAASSGSREMRINGELGVSRALGDTDYEKWGLSHDADTTLVRRTAADEWLVLGCDGLWDSVAEGLAAQALEGCATAQEAADRLVALAFARAAEDNVSVAVMDLRRAAGDDSAALEVLGMERSQLAATLASPSRGLALRPLGSVAAGFSAASLVDLLCETGRRPGCTREQAVAVGQELAWHGLLRHERHSALFADDENLVFTLGDELLEQRLKLGRLPTGRVRGPPFYLACPVCYACFADVPARTSHACAKLARV